MADTHSGDYRWDDSANPILDLHLQLGHDPAENIAVSYIGPDGAWNTRHVRLQFADAFARSLAAGQNNVYVMVNEVRALAAGSTGRGDASTVTRLKALWADLDFKDSGLQNAAAAREVIATLSGLLNANPVAVVFSGYGLQPYWEVEEGEINDTNRVYVMGLLKRWGQLVQRVASLDGGHVDPVYDLPRVLRAPGTYNWKNPDDAIPTQLALLPESTPVNFDLLEDVLVAHGFEHADNPMDEFIVVSPPESWEPAEHDCAWAAGLVDEITQSNPTARHPWLVGKAVKIDAGARNGCLTTETHAELVKLLAAKFEDLLASGGQSRKVTANEIPATFKWARALVSTFDDAKLAQAVGYHTHKFGQLRGVPNLPKESADDADTTNSARPAAPAVPASRSHGDAETQGALALKPQQAIQYATESFAYTDTANGARLAARMVGEYIFVPNVGWHVWEGARYIRDETNTVLRAAVDSAMKYAAEDTSDASKKWATLSLTLGKLQAAVTLASTDPLIAVPARKLDAEAYELCTPNGIVDLRTGQLRPGNPYLDRHTKQATVAPDGAVAIDEWIRFLQTVIVDQERIDYLQELFGVALVGEVIDASLPMFIGVGANGKSTLFEVLTGMLADYVVTLPENFLLDNGRQEHPTEIMRLRGARIALGSETRPDAKFNEARAKLLTGGDTLTGRSMGKDFVDFKPTHSVLLGVNHPPKVSTGGSSFFRRMRKVDFNVVIPPEQQDKTLAKRLVRDEGAGILAWMLEGTKRVLERGSVKTPESVLGATADYQSEEDHLQQFMDARVTLNPFSNLSGAEIYNNYTNWCSREGEERMSKIALMRELAKRTPLVKDRLAKGQRYTGIQLFED